MRIQILDEAEDDLRNGREFYDRQELGVGDYFAAALAADIDSLILFVGIRPMEFGYHRALSKRFPFGVYYLVGKGSSTSMQCSTSAAIRHGFAAD